MPRRKEELCVMTEVYDDADYKDEIYEKRIYEKRIYEKDKSGQSSLGSDPVTDFILAGIKRQL